MHLAIRASNRVIFSGADKFSQVSLLAPEFMTLILQIGTEKYVTMIVQSVSSENHDWLVKCELITFQGEKYRKWDVRDGIYFQVTLSNFYLKSLILCQRTPFKWLSCPKWNCTVAWGILFYFCSFLFFWSPSLSPGKHTYKKSYLCQDIQTWECSALFLNSKFSLWKTFKLHVYYTPGICCVLSWVSFSSHKNPAV